MVTFWITYKVVPMCRNSWSSPWSISLLTKDIIIKSLDGQDMRRVAYKGEEGKNTVIFVHSVQSKLNYVLRISSIFQNFSQ